MEEEELVAHLFNQFVQTFSPSVRSMVEQNDGSVSVLHFHSIYQKGQLVDFNADALLALPPPPGTPKRVTAGFINFLKPFLRRGENTVWTSQTVISTLVTHYKITLCHSRGKIRNANRQADSPLPLSYGSLYSDVGQYFQLLGRDDTYRVLLHGGLQMFKNFVSKSPSSFERQAAFFALVAFPGAGKSTFGLDFNMFMIEMWLCIPEEQRMSILRGYLGDETLVCEYLDMLKQFECVNLCCYHSLEVTATGRWLQKENGLHAAQVLALRCMHAAIYEPDSHRYDDFLSELQEKWPGLCQHITLKDVIQVIRSCLGFEHDKRLLIGWYIDEANGARGSFPDAMIEGVTWFQEVLSEYVIVLDGLRRDNSPTFPVMSIGTTRFSAGTLKLTKTRRARAFVVPLRPLRMAESRSLVTCLMHRLALTTDEQRRGEEIMPCTLELMLCFCGGIPRMLALLLQTLLDESPSRSPQCLLMSMRKQWSHNQALSLLRRLLGRVSRTDYFLGYLTDPCKTVVLLRALAASVLGVTVMRQSKVLEEDASFTDTWGDLESEGLVALNLYKSPSIGINRKALVTAVDVGNVDVQVQLCPLLLFHFSERQLALPGNQTWAFSVPSVHEKWWNKIEGAHVAVLMFKLQLLNVSYGRDTFSVRELFPPYVNVPGRLQSLCFEMPSKDHDKLCASPQLRTQDEFLSHVRQHSNSYAFIGPGNFGADSWLCLKEINSGKLLHVCLQSRSTVSGRYVTCKKIMESFSQDCGRWFALPQVTPKQNSKREKVYGQSSNNTEELMEISDEEMEEVVRGDLEFIYVYCTDEVVSSRTLSHLQELVSADDPWAQRIILWYNTQNLDASDPLALLSLLRYIKEYPSQ